MLQNFWDLGRWELGAQILKAQDSWVFVCSDVVEAQAPRSGAERDFWPPFLAPG